MRRCSGSKGALDGLLRYAVQRFWIRGDEQGGAAARQQVQPSGRQIPRELWRDGSAIGIQVEKSPMLRSAERQCIDAHAPRTVEIASAGVVPGTLQLEQSGSQMAEGVAADDQCAAGRFAVWPVRSIDEGIGLLTGMQAGARGPDGAYPTGSLNRAVEDRLRQFAKVRKAAGEGRPGGDDT